MLFKRIIGTIIIILVLAISMGLSIRAFFDLRALLIVIGTLTGGIIFSYGLNLPLEALKCIFKNKEQKSDLEFEQFINFYNLASQLSIAGGVIGSFIGIIRMLHSMSDPSSIGPGYASCILSALYGIILSELIFQPMKYFVIFNNDIDKNNTIITNSNSKNRLSSFIILWLFAVAGIVPFFIMIFTFETNI